MNEDFLTSLQEAVAVRLGEHEEFISARVKILTDSEGDLGTLIDAVAQERGLAVAVIAPKVAPGAVDRQITVSMAVSVQELARTNRGPKGTGLYARPAAMDAWAALEGWSPGSEGWTPFEFAGLNLLALAPKVIWELQMVTRNLTRTTEG